MFSKLSKVSATHGGASLQQRVEQSHSSPLLDNQLGQQFDVGRLVGSAGPELAWKLYNTVRRSDKKEATIFFFDKRTAERLHKPRRKEAVADVLRFGAKQLDRYRHPKVLSLVHPLEETSDTLAFATEQLIGSLANVLGCFEERLPVHGHYEARGYQFLNFEIKYGLSQLTEALQYLHFSCHVIHKNISPQSILINKRGTWKLAGFEFTEKAAAVDNVLATIRCQQFTTKLPKMCQPDLDYSAPEIQCSGTCSPQSDMFSLGLVVCAMYNDSRSPLESNIQLAQYARQLDHLNITAQGLFHKMDPQLPDPLQGLLDRDPARRPNSQNFVLIPFLVDSGVQALQYLDAINMKDANHKLNFYHTLPSVLADIPKKLWYQHMVPSMATELLGSDCMGAALQPLLLMIEEATNDDYAKHLQPVVKQLYTTPRSVQATVTLLENIDVLMRKSTAEEIRDDLLPMMFGALDSTMPQIQSAALHAIPQMVDGLDTDTIRRTILPKTKQVFESNSLAPTQANALTCVEHVIDSLEKSDILDDVLPMLLKAKLNEPLLLLPVVPSKVLPSLTPAMVAPNIRMEEFSCLTELIQDMLEHVARNQRNKLKLERLSISSNEGGGPGISMHRMPDQPIGYPHRPPGLRIENRRTSISVDDVVRRTQNSRPSSPDSNLLRVQANLPGRRHSDNTIQPPRIFVQSPAGSAGGGSRWPSASVIANTYRRHSAAPAPQTAQYQSPIGLPSFLTQYKTPERNNIDFVIPSYQRTSPTPGARRFSSAVVYNNQRNLPGVPPQGQPDRGPSPNSLLQSLGSGMQQLFGN